MIPLPLALSVLLVVLVIAFFVGRTMRPTGLPHSEEEKRRLVAAAEVEAESLKRQAALDAKELAQKARVGDRCRAERAPGGAGETGARDQRA